MAWYDYALAPVSGLGAVGQQLGVGGFGDAANYLKNTFSAPPSQYADSSQIHDVINRGLAGSAGRQAPQISYDNNQFRNGQQQQIGQLQGIASGQQQGAGELAAQRQTNNAVAAQSAQAHMARGGNAALAYRQAAQNSQGIGLQGAGLGQQAALSDQMNAQGMLTNALGQGRGQDQAMQQANLEAQLRQTGMNDQQIQAYLAQLTGMDANQLNAAQAAHAAQQQMVGGIIGQVGQVAGSALAHSDERLKTDISAAGDSTDALMDALTPYRYRYKDERHGVGPRIGIMAQDLEKSELGRGVVFEAPDGKALDINKALSAALAGTARLNERLKRLEGR